MMDSFWDIFWRTFVVGIFISLTGIILILPMILFALFDCGWWLLGFLITMPFAVAVACALDG